MLRLSLCRSTNMTDGSATMVAEELLYKNVLAPRVELIHFLFRYHNH